MNRLTKYIFLTLFSLLGAIDSFSQTGSSQNPPVINWKVINSGHFEVIFPDILEDEAQKTLNTMEHIFKPVSNTLQEPKKISLILQNQLSQSNGFVSFIPRRMEYYNTPPQSFFAGTNSWYNLLNIHELRHVVQIDKINTRFNGIISLLFGAAVEQNFEAFSIPAWYMEGDATLTETLLTNSGRGRIPAFNVELRALLLSGKRYSYDQSIFGSYKDWNPLESPYLLGYYLDAHIRRNYGAEALSNTLYRTSLLPFIPFMFSLALNAEIDRGIFKNYVETINEIDTLFRKDVKDIKITKDEILHRIDTTTWTYNYAPQFLSNNEVFVYRLGLDNIGTFIKIDKNSKDEVEILKTRSDKL